MHSHRPNYTYALHRSPIPNTRKQRISNMSQPQNYLPTRRHLISKEIKPPLKNGPSSHEERKAWLKKKTNDEVGKGIRVGSGWAHNFTNFNAWKGKGVCYPCGNFSDTSSLKLVKTKGSIGHAFTVCIHTENQNQVSFYPFVLHEISVLIELTLGHLRYHLTDVPPQPNSQPDSVFDSDGPAQERP